MVIDDELKPGSIIYLYIQFPHQEKPENKYMIVASLDPLLLFEKIGSDKNQSRLAIKFNEYQFKLKRSIYPFLEYDSYVNCGTLWHHMMEFDELYEQIREDNNRIKGMLIPDHVNEMLRLMNKSKSIDARYMKMVRLAFGKDL